MAKNLPAVIVIPAKQVPVRDLAGKPGKRSAIARPPAPGVDVVPALVGDVGRAAAKRFTTFFTDDIANANTRRAYHRAAMQFFTWCGDRGLSLPQIESIHVAAYREVLMASLAPSSVKQHLAAIRKLFDWLIIGQIVASNPAHAVRGPRHVVTEGLTPILGEEDAKALLASIDVSHVVGRRDRALIALMIATFSRIHAAIGMDVRHYFPDGKQWSVRLSEKNGKVITMPVHHKLESYLDEYIQVAGIAEQKRRPLFRTSRGQSRTLTAKRMSENDAWRMIRRRAADAGIKAAIGNHTFRGTGITNFLENGGKIEDAQKMAGHADTRTTKLYDRREHSIHRGEVEKISALG